MSNETTRRGALGLIAVGLGLPGVTKLADAGFTRVKFSEWGYPDPAKYVIGAIELGVGATAAAELHRPQARPVAAVGTLCAMSCALATHVRAHDSVPNYGPPLALVAAAVLALRTG